MWHVAVLLISIYPPSLTRIYNMCGVEVARWMDRVSESDTVAGIGDCPPLSPPSPITPETIALTPLQIVWRLSHRRRSCAGWGTRGQGGWVRCRGQPVALYQQFSNAHVCAASFRAAPHRVIVYLSGVFFSSFPLDPVRSNRRSSFTSNRFRQAVRCPLTPTPCQART